MSEYKVKIDKVIEDMAFIEAPDGRVITTGSKVATSHVMANLLNSETAALRSQIAEAQARIASQSDTIESLQTANYRLEMEIAAAEEMAERLSTEKSSALIEQGNLAAQLAEAQAKNARLVAERSWMLALIKNMPRMGHSSILTTVEEILERASQAAPAEAPKLMVDDHLAYYQDDGEIYLAPDSNKPAAPAKKHFCSNCGKQLGSVYSISDYVDGQFCSAECVDEYEAEREVPKAPADVTLTDAEIDWLAERQLASGRFLERFTGAITSYLNIDFSKMDCEFGSGDYLYDKIYTLKPDYDTPANRAAIEARRKELGLV
jgi:hypothetical protein